MFCSSCCVDRLRQFSLKSHYLNKILKKTRRFKSGQCCTTGESLQGCMHLLVLAYDFVGRMQNESEEMCVCVCICASVCIYDWLPSSLFIPIKTKPQEICEFCQHLLTALFFLSFSHSFSISLCTSCSFSQKIAFWES